ncbi:hypothetical protein CYMTET_53297 [Cymbomonas tetramitiformis]|uniref:Uncharacterized protein n=1 Tax=Cymbomonas tetramitiformis TaxID=36881 RepID=A0AAE0BIP6_9CHLO|nr:hypothetical protein CYMTET_53297 [Cymbomonas tetramitiformis]
MSSTSVLRILAFPVFKRKWVFQAWSAGVSGSTAESPVIMRSDQEARVQPDSSTLLAKARSFMLGFQPKVYQTGAYLWQRASTSPPMSFYGAAYRIGNYLLDRLDPIGLHFLSQVPHKVERVELIYPSSIDERLVRRRLRLIVTRHAKVFRSRALRNLVIIGPALPLAFTPFPNLPIYWLGWRLLSDHNAYQAGQRLEAFLNNPGLQIMHRVDETCASQQADVPKYGDAELLIQGSDVLDQIIKPSERWETPLKTEAAKAVAEQFSVPDLDVAVTRYLAYGRR